MKNYKLLLVSLMLLPLTIFSQDRYLRIEGGTGTTAFVGDGDGNVYYDNNSLNLGFILEKEGDGNAIFTSDHVRKYYGLRYRKLEASTHSTILNGTERYRYDNLEIPLGLQIDWISLFKHSIVLGTDFGISGSIPLKMEGERSGPDVSLPWSDKYERPWFIFGFQFGLYGGINFGDKLGIKYGAQLQFPFIPIGASPPDNLADVGYKSVLLSDRFWTLALNYKLNN
ncbi:MAG: hypothetical protein IPH42_00935 [Bacteroidetes bacterium]|nr:hypothetical protein [Bacteroidota bacterium]